MNKAKKMSSVKIELRKDQVEKIKQICKSFDHQPGELINVLHKCQSEFGYLPAEIQEIVASGAKYFCCKSLWGRDILFLFYNDTQREISYFHLYWYSLLCKRSRKCACRI